MNTTQLIENLHQQLASKAVPSKKYWMEAYMRNQFPFLGVNAPDRKIIFMDWYRQSCSAISSTSIEELIRELYAREEREFQYIAVELFYKKLNAFNDDQIAQILHDLITNKSWWDTVDILATSAAGRWLKGRHELQYESVKKWLDSGNIWLMRTAIIFQLKYKQNTDTTLLESAIISTMHTKDFFIQKAIGWTLREYSKTNPAYVCLFVDKYRELMSSMALREALKHLRKKGLLV